MPVREEGMAKRSVELKEKVQKDKFEDPATSEGSMDDCAAAVVESDFLEKLNGSLVG